MSKKSVVKRKKKPSALIPVVLGLAVVYLFWTGASKQAEELVQPVHIPFAVETLYAHDEITEDDITVREVPAQSVPPNAVLDPNELVGMYVDTNKVIPTNSMFFEESVTEFGDIPSRISMMLEGDSIGLTMRVNLEQSVANSLKDDMDVQVRFLTNNTPSGNTFEGVLEERIRVLAVRDNRGEDIVVDEEGNTRVPTVIVFDATDEQTSYLLRAQELGTLNLVAISEENEDELNKEGQMDDADLELLEGQDEEEQQLAMMRALIEDNVEDEEMAEEQIALLESLFNTGEQENRGELFSGNEVKLFIDSLTHRIQHQFDEDNYFVTPTGEVVIYDEELNELRYFESREEFQGSEYVLQEMTDEELEAYFESMQESEEIQEDMDIPSTNNNDDQNTGTSQTNQEDEYDFVYRGQGNDTTDTILLESGISLVEFQHDGNGEFIVNLIDENGRETEVVSESGEYNAKKAITARNTGNYVFEIKASNGGRWEIRK